MRCRIRSVPWEVRDAACVSINFTTVPHPFSPPSSTLPLPSLPALQPPTYPRVVHSTVLQIKPACTSLIEQNFNTGSTRNSAPWVTKHRVNTMVHTSPRCKRHNSTAVIKRGWGMDGKELCIWIFVETQRHGQRFRWCPSPSIVRASGVFFFFRRARLIHRQLGETNVMEDRTFYIAN